MSIRDRAQLVQRGAAAAAQLGLSADEWAALSARERKELLEELDMLDQMSPRSRARHEAKLTERAHVAHRNAAAAARLGMSAEEWAALSAEERTGLLEELDVLDRMSPRSHAVREAELKEQAQAQLARRGAAAAARLGMSAEEFAALSAEESTEPARLYNYCKKVPFLFSCLFSKDVATHYM